MARPGQEGRPRRPSVPAEEADKRDHRKLGKLMDLFHVQDEAPGMVFWHPTAGASGRSSSSTRKVYENNGYQGK